YWRLFHKIRLSLNVRCSDPEFQRRLLAIGDGRVGIEDQLDRPNGKKVITLENSLMQEGGIEGLINFVYDRATLGNIHILASSCILAPTNKEVDQIHERVLTKLVRSHGRQVPEASYLSFHKILPDSDLDENV